jgi:hypothetical protein
MATSKETAGEKLLEETRRLYQPAGSAKLDEAVGIAPIYQGTQKRLGDALKVATGVMYNPDAWSEEGVDAVSAGIENYGKTAKGGLENIDKVLAKYPNLGPELQNILLEASNNVPDLETRNVHWLTYLADYMADSTVTSELREAVAKKNKEISAGLAAYAKEKLTKIVGA